MRSAVVVAVLCGSMSWAADRKALVGSALEALKEVQEEVEGAPAACRKKVSPLLETLDDSLRATKKSGDVAELKAASRAADKASDAAQDACSGATGKRVAKLLAQTSSAIDEARDQKDEAPPPVLGAIAQGLGGLFAGAAVKGAAHEESTSNSSSSSKTTRTEQVNGRDLEPDEPDPRDPFGDKKRDAERKKKAEGPSRGEFGATCTSNSECDSNSCYKGTGSLGYCTKICSSDDDCPRKMFEWSCYRPRNLNAPQKLCLQSN